MDFARNHCVMHEQNIRDSMWVLVAGSPCLSAVFPRTARDLLFCREKRGRFRIPRLARDDRGSIVRILSGAVAGSPRPAAQRCCAPAKLVAHRCRVCTRTTAGCIRGIDQPPRIAPAGDTLRVALMYWLFRASPRHRGGGSLPVLLHGAGHLHGDAAVCRHRRDQHPGR